MEALERGAGRAVGLELNRERLRQATEIARLRGLNPEYVRADIEGWSLEAFDTILCLNVLHHLLDPIGTLRKLALNTRETLVIEAASLTDHDAAKHGLNKPMSSGWFRSGPTAAETMRGHPLAYIGPFQPSGLRQTFFFTASGLRRILDGHMRLFQRIEEFPSEHKGRYILRCTRLKVDRLVVVAGTCSSGKSTLCEGVKRNEYAETLGIADMTQTQFVAPTKLWRGATEDSFPEAKCSSVLFHYDIALIERFGLHHHSRDPSTDLLRCAENIDFLIVAPSRETLKLQLVQSEGRDGELVKQHHKKYLALYDHPTWLADLYSDWIEFCAEVAPQGRFMLYIEDGEDRKLVPCQSAAEAASRVSAIYKPILASN